MSLTRAQELSALRATKARVARTCISEVEVQILELERETSILEIAYQALLRRKTWAWSPAEKFSLENTLKPDAVQFLQTHNTDPELWKKLES